MNDGTAGSQFRMILNAIAPDYNFTSLIYTDGVVAGRSYAVKYRAVNSYGEGDFSQESIIYAGIPPTPVKPVYFYLEGSNIIVEWNDTFIDNGFPIQSYNVFINYFNLKECNGSEALIIAAKKCSFPMSVLTNSD